MTIQEYRDKSAIAGYIEYPASIWGGEPKLADFLNYVEAEHSLKIYLTQMVLCKCFPLSGGYFWQDDLDWLIKGFLVDFQQDPLKSWLTETILEAIGMIASEEVFTKGVIGTTFMFGVIEYEVKYYLGYRPQELDFFDKENHKRFRTMSIGKALDKLKETDLAIATSLNEIDRHNSDNLLRSGMEERRYVKAKIADRVTLARNTMLHGESHSFYEHGHYLVNGTA
jgi:hypothetical protein